MIARPLVSVNVNETEIARVAYHDDIERVLLIIDVRHNVDNVRTNATFECELPVASLQPLIVALTDMVQPCPIALTKGLRIVVVPRASEAVFLIVAKGNQVHRAVRLNCFARKRFIVGLEHARVIADPDLLSEAAT